MVAAISFKACPLTERIYWLLLRLRRTFCKQPLKGKTHDTPPHTLHSAPATPINRQDRLGPNLGRDYPDLNISRKHGAFGRHGRFNGRPAMNQELRTLAFARTHILNCLTGLRLCQTQSEYGPAQEAYQSVIETLRDELVALAHMETKLKGDEE
jgi:hypothetical protein